MDSFWMDTFDGNSTVMKWGCGPSELETYYGLEPQGWLEGDLLPESIGVVVT